MTKPEGLLEMLHRIDTADPRLEPTREEWARAAGAVGEVRELFTSVIGRLTEPGNVPDC